MGRSIQSCSPTTSLSDKHGNHRHATPCSDNCRRPWPHGLLGSPGGGVGTDCCECGEAVVEFEASRARGPGLQRTLGMRVRDCPHVCPLSRSFAFWLFRTAASALSCPPDWTRRVQAGAKWTRESQWISFSWPGEGYRQSFFFCSVMGVNAKVGTTWGSLGCEHGTGRRCYLLPCGTDSRVNLFGIGSCFCFLRGVGEFGSDVGSTTVPRRTATCLATTCAHEDLLATFGTK